MVAITVDGDAVYFPDLTAEPTLLYDGPAGAQLEVEEGPGPNVVDAVAITEDASRAWIGTCCEPAAGAVIPATPPEPVGDMSATLFGYNPAVDPSGTYLALGQINGPVASITAVADGELLSDPAGAPIGPGATPYDVVWLSTDRLAVLSSDIDRSSWTVSAAHFDGSTVVVDQVVDVAPFAIDDDTVHRFGGMLPDGRLAVLPTGASSVFAVPLDGSGEVGTVDLDGPTMSVWFEGGDEPALLVDDRHRLWVDGRTLAGEHTWARR